MTRHLLLLIIPLGVLHAAEAPVSFELKPRRVTTGRDPQIVVRASGAVSLLKVDKGNLWLHTSFDGGDSFESPVRMNSSEDEVASHGESSPQMAMRSRSEFYVLWQARTKGDSDASRLHFARSTDWGESFTKSMEVDASPSSQSFFTMALSPKGAVYVAWLDGRDRGKGKPGTASVYLARSTDRGVTFEKSVRVGGVACPCCRPFIGFGAGETVHAAWRSVLDNDVRDMVMANSVDGGKTWSEATRIAEDNWCISGCPHSGASMAVLGERLFVSWYTVRDEKAAIYLAHSDDGGRTFSSRTLLSEGVLDPNHPSLVVANNKILAVFQGRGANDNNGWGKLAAYYREIDQTGKFSPLVRIGRLEGSASYPVLTWEAPGKLFVTWTESNEEGSHIVLARGRSMVAPNAR